MPRYSSGELVKTVGMLLAPWVATVFPQQRNERLDFAAIVRDEIPAEIEPPQQGLQITVRGWQLRAKQVA